MEELYHISKMILGDCIKFLLFIIASILKWALQPVLFTYGVFRSLSKGLLANYVRDLAIAKDCYGNVLGQHLFNDVLISKKSKHLFGSIRQTISAIIGYNYMDRTSLFLGKVIYKTLDTIEEAHCEKAVLSDKVNVN